MISSGEMHPDMLKALAGMISVGEMHPDMLKSSCRDDFQRGNAS